LIAPLQAKILGLLILLRRVPLYDVAFAYGEKCSSIVHEALLLERAGFVRYGWWLELTEAGAEACMGVLAGSRRRWWIAAAPGSEAWFSEHGFAFRDNVAVAPLNRLLLPAVEARARHVAVVAGRIGSVWVHRYGLRTPFRSLWAAYSALDRGVEAAKRGGHREYADSCLRSAIRHARWALEIAGLGPVETSAAGIEEAYRLVSAAEESVKRLLAERGLLDVDLGQADKGV